MKNQKTFIGKSLFFIILVAILSFITGCKVERSYKSNARKMGQKIGHRFYNGCSLFSGDGFELRKAFQTQAVFASLSDRDREICKRALDGIQSTLSATNVSQLVTFREHLDEYEQQLNGQGRPGIDAGTGGIGYSNSNSTQNTLSKAEAEKLSEMRKQLRYDMRYTAENYSLAVEHCGTNNPIFIAQLARTGLSLAAASGGVGVSPDQLDTIDLVTNIYQTVKTNFSNFSDKMRIIGNSNPHLGVGEMPVAYRCAIEAVAGSVCETTSVVTTLDRKKGGHFPLQLSRSIREAIEDFEETADSYLKIKKSMLRAIAFPYKGKSFTMPCQFVSKKLTRVMENNTEEFSAYMHRMYKDNTMANKLANLSQWLGNSDTGEVEILRQIWQQAVRVYLSKEAGSLQQAYRILAQKSASGINFFDRVYREWSKVDSTLGNHVRQTLERSRPLSHNISFHPRNLVEGSRFYLSQPAQLSPEQKKYFNLLRAADRLAAGITKDRNHFLKIANSVMVNLPRTITAKELQKSSNLDAAVEASMQTLNDLPTELLKLNKNVFSEYISGLKDKVNEEESAAQYVDQSDPLALSSKTIGGIYKRQMKRFCRASLAMKFADNKDGDEEILKLLDNNVCGTFSFNGKTYRELMVHRGDVQGFRAGKHDSGQRLGAFRGRICRSVAIDEVIGGGTFDPTGRSDSSSSSAGAGSLGAIEPSSTFQQPPRGGLGGTSGVTPSPLPTK